MHKWQNDTYLEQKSKQYSPKCTPATVQLNPMHSNARLQSCIGIPMHSNAQSPAVH